MALVDPLKCPNALQDSSGNKVEPPNTLTILNPDLPVSGIDINKISVGGSIVAQVSGSGNIVLDKINLLQIIRGNPDPSNLKPYVLRLGLSGKKTSTDGEAVGGSNVIGGIPLLVTISAPAGGSASILSCSSLNTPFQLGTKQEVTCIAPRNGSCASSSAANTFFCSLKEVDNAGCSQCARFSCKIAGPDASGVWTLQGTRGDDPAITCKMQCFSF